jgi:DNA repair exonuclease SbcCD nuclease subunit
MDTMKEAGLPVFAIQGQHDYAEPPWTVATHDHVRYVHRELFEPIPGFHVYGIEYCNKVDLQDEIKKVPDGVEAVMLHQLARPVFKMEGVWNFDPAWLPSSVRYAIMGDFHESVQFNWGPDTLGYYSGSMHMQELSEDFEKYFVDEKYVGGNLHIDYIKLRTRPYFTHTIDFDQDLEDVCELIEQMIVDEPWGNWDVTTPVITIKFVPTVENVEQRIIEASAGRMITVVKPISTRTDIAFDVSNGAPVVDMEAALTKLVPRDSLEYKFVLDLLKRPPDEVFTDFKKDMGVIAST